MASTLKLTPSVLQFYIDNAEIPYEILQEKCKYIDLFLSGEKNPTFKQISDVAKKLNVPTGLLLLPKPIEIDNKKLEFRTVGSTEIGKMSENLRDTIADMEKKQDFLRDIVEDDLDFIGSISINDDLESTTTKIRKLLGIDVLWQSEVDNNSDAFKFFRKRLNSLGISVFLNGIVGQHTRRPLDIKEFRGFTLIDKKVPLIFINSTDTDAGRLFTLIHEFIHLVLGSSGIVNKIYLDDYSFSPLEAFANKVTAEILVPKTELLNKKSNDIPALARNFKVSEYVIVRRLLDCQILTQADYSDYVKELEKLYKSRKENQKKSSGGNYYNTAQSRIDNSFFHIVKNAIHSDKVTYTKAFDVLGVSARSFKGLEAIM